MRFWIIFLLPLFLACNSYNKYSIHNATVMITNLEQTSGGSGTILRSSEAFSLILTNAHVCNVAVKGGIVTTSDQAEYFVKSYAQSKIHDLCLLEVASNLHINTEISPTELRVLDNVVVSGHPTLLPNILTYGHYAGPKIVTIAIGYKPCSVEDQQNPETALLCLFTGMVPLLREYESSVVSALIEPGSSGSAVYNERGQIAAVIFAGGRSLTYGLAVPHSYILNFLLHELKTLNAYSPSYEK